MSAIQPIDVATPNRAMPVPPSAGSGAAAPGQPFADVIRSAVSPAQTVSATRPEQTPQRASYPLVASTSSRLRFHGSSITAGMKSNRADASVSPSPSQPAKGKASMQTTDLDDDNVDSSAAASSSSVDLNGAASSPVEEQAQSSILVTSVGGRSSEGTPQQALTDATQAGSLPAVNGRKQNGSAKEATKSQDASTIAATVTSIGIASVAGIVAKPAVVNLPGEHGAAASVNEPAPSKLKSVGSPAMPVNSSISNRAPAPGLTPPTPQADGFTGAAAMQPHGAGVSSDGAAANPATATKTTATSSADQNGGSDGFGGNQPASAQMELSGHASTNGILKSSADANTSTAVSATGAVSSGAGGNNAVGSGANGTATFDSQQRWLEKRRFHCFDADAGNGCERSSSSTCEPCGLGRWITGQCQRCLIRKSLCRTWRFFRFDDRVNGAARQRCGCIYGFGQRCSRGARSIVARRAPSSCGRRF